MYGAYSIIEEFALNRGRFANAAWKAYAVGARKTTKTKTVVLAYHVKKSTNRA